MDASTPVAELLRERGQVLLASPHLEVYVPARMWDEARHEVPRRIRIRVRKGWPQEIADRFWDAAVRLKDESVAEVPEELYEGLRDEALSRLPRDPDDWQVVALALSLRVDILTADEDFFGCGVATWTVGTLISQLERRDQSPF
ncbi:MAG: PIN domain-containing protein [Actinomycetota bacterium]|nr:PIN domain-containing protein [Actinomycetota bacterium]